MSRKKIKLQAAGALVMQPCAQGRHSECCGGPVAIQHPDVTSGKVAPGTPGYAFSEGRVCKCACHAIRSWT